MFSLLSTVGATTFYAESQYYVVRTYTRPIVTDRVAWSVGQSVGLSVTQVSPAKTAAPIEMPFGLRTRVGPRNHILDGAQIPHGKEGAILMRRASHCKI